MTHWEFILWYAAAAVTVSVVSRILHLRNS